MIGLRQVEARRPDFGSPGAGSQPHLAAELLFRDAGVKGLIVPFRGDTWPTRNCWRAVSTHVDRAQHRLAAHPERARCVCWVWRRPSAVRFTPSFHLA